MTNRSMDNYSGKLCKVGPTTWWGNLVYRHPWYVRNVLCEDGKRRTAYLGSDADTFFSWPARVKIKGHWVKGFVTTDHDEDTLFTANRTPDPV